MTAERRSAAGTGSVGPHALAHGQHLAALTGLRGVAALWVLAFHCWQFAGSPRVAIGPVDVTFLFATGFFGVDLFFVLSGFLLGLPFVHARLQCLPPPALGQFWRRRVRRVLPAYWAQLAILLAIGWIASGALPVDGGELLAHLLLAFNVYDNSSPVNPVYWSLPVEWDFYLLLPLLALGIPRRGAPWLLPLAVAFAIGFRLACGLALDWWGAEGVPFYRWVLQLPGRVDQFAFGMAAAWLLLRGVRPRTALLLGLAGCAGLLLQAWLTAPRGDFVTGADMDWLIWHYTAVAAAMAAIVLAAAANAGPVARAMAVRPLLGAGVVSYSLYLWHYPLLGALRALTPELPPWLLWGVLAPLLAGAVATASYWLVERPFLRGTRHRAPVPAASAP